MATSSVSSSSSKALYQASGLASGMDTAGIVDKLIAAESAPLTQLSTRKAAYNVQISTISTLTSQLTAFQTAADALGKSGVTVNSSSSTYSDFTLSGSSPTQANYTLQVEKMALAAKARSTTPISSATDASKVPDGNLQFTIDGTASAVIDTTGLSLAQVASTINDQVSSVSASVVNTGSGYVLAIARKTTGYSSSPAGALQITQDPGLGLNVTQQAQNAKVWMDGLEVDSQSNTITDALPGVTIGLTGASNTAQQVSFSNDQNAAVNNLNKFINAYNTVAKTITSQLHVNPSSGSGEELLDGSTMHSLQRSMQQLLSNDLIGTGYARTLADLGVEMQKDGTLTLDQTQFSKAVAADPTGVNKIFSTATTGIAAKVDALVSQQTKSGTGVLITRTDSLKKLITGIDDKTAQINTALDNERTLLTASFSAMEDTMSSMNSISTYLTNLDAQRAKNT